MLTEIKISMHNRHPLVDKSISSTSIHCFLSVSARSCQFSSTRTLHSDSRKKMILLKMTCVSASLCLYGKNTNTLEYFIIEINHTMDKCYYC